MEKLRLFTRRGFAIRPATMDDLEAAVHLFNAYSMASIGVRQFSTDETSVEWRTPGFDLENATRAFYSPDGEMIGYIEVWDIADPPVHPWVWGCVHPKWKRQGIGTILMNWAVERAAQVIPLVPEEARVAIMTYAPSTHKPTKALLESMNMKVIRHSWRMIIHFDREPTKPTWPQGITLQDYNHPQDAEVFFNAEKEIFQDHWGNIRQPFESAFKRWFHHTTGREGFDPTLWTLAMDGQEIAGLIRCRPNDDEVPETGWVSVIGVRRPWRGRGLGFALLQHAFGQLYRRGRIGAALGVDAKSITGATRLYEKANMQVDRQYDIYELEIRPGIELRTEKIG